MKITISGQSVRFKANALFPVKYKSETGRDIFKDMKEIEKFKDLTIETIEKFNVDILLDIVYVLAWFGDKNIGERNEWMLSFDDFNVYEIFPEVSDLLAKSLAPTKKKKNPHKAKAKIQA